VKVTIEATQDEFNQKRADLAKAIAGKTFALVNKSEVSPMTPRRGKFKAQKEMLNFYDAEFKKMLEAIKADINEIIG